MRKNLIRFTVTWIMSCYCFVYADLNESVNFTFQALTTDWKLKNSDVNVPLVLFWKVTNNSTEKKWIPIGNQTTFELIDDTGQSISGGESSDGFIPLSYSDFRLVKPSWTTLISVGDLSLYWIERRAFFGGPTRRGGWIEYGPLKSGKYKLQSKFTTALEPSEYAKKLATDKNLFLGNLTSKPQSISIEIEQAVVR